MIPTLHISLLGDFLLLVGERPLSASTIPRVQFLLAYLVLHRNASVDRSHLAFLLWPDSSEAQAHTNLRQLLYHLRQSLPYADQFLHANKHSLQWLPKAVDSTFTLDVHEMERALLQARQAEQDQNTSMQRQALEQVMRLYRGDLLPGCYEEWILPERDRLRQTFLSAAQSLIALLEQERDYNAAIVVAHTLLRHDPLHEATYRYLMRLYALQGDRASALRFYHTCTTVLERELDTEPSAVTRTMYESLMRADNSSETPSSTLSERTPEAALFGRKAEWKRLQQIWRKATDSMPGQQAGSAHIVLLTGEAGIGKTRLAKELEVWVSRLGMSTASASCYAMPGHLAYAPVIAWLRSAAFQTSLPDLDPTSLTEIARLLPEVLVTQPHLSAPAAMTESWQQQHLFAALARAVSAVRQPLLLLLDDLQWCDQETLQWLQYLLHFAPTARLLVLGTVRIEETSIEHPLFAFLGTLQRDGLVSEIPLEPLTSSETTSLAEHILGRQLDFSMSTTLYRETEGNPFFVVEMAQVSKMGRSQSIIQPSLLTPSASDLPAAMQAVLATRLGQLSVRARNLANVAAVIGREFSFSVLAQASGESEESLVQGLDELWQRRIVREHDGGITNGYDFSHDKLRVQTYTSLSSAHCRLLHRRVAEAFQAVYVEDQDPVCGQIAAHYEQAGLPVQAIPFYRRAGEVASQIYANVEAFHMFERAATLLEARLPPGQAILWETAVQVYTSLGDVSVATGAYEEARQAYCRAMARLPLQASLWKARLHWKIATTWKHASAKDHDIFHINAQRAFEEAERILSDVADPASSDWRNEWIALQFAQIWPGRGSVDEMAVAIEKARPFVEQHGTQEQRKLLAEFVGVYNAIRNRYVIPAQKVSAWRATIASMEPTANEAQRGMELALFGIGLLSAAQFDEAEEQLYKALQIGERTGNAWLQKNCLTFLLFVFRQRGQLEEMRRILAQAQAVGVAQNNSILTGHRAWVAWRDGELAPAESYARESIEEERYQHIKHNPFLWTGRWPLIGVALAKEQIGLAIDNLRLLFDLTQQPPAEPLSSLLETVLQVWDAGEHDKAHALLQEALPLAEKMCYL